MVIRANRPTDTHEASAPHAGSLLGVRCLESNDRIDTGSASPRVCARC